MFNNDDLVDLSEAPLDVASNSFESKRFLRVSDNSIGVKPTLFALCYSFLFIFLGFTLIALLLFRTFTSFDGPGSLPLALIGLLFLFTGFVIFYNHDEQVLIEKGKGVNFKRSWRLNNLFDRSAYQQSYRSEDVEKVQLLSHGVKHRSNRSKRRNSYIEYQVNLVLKGGDRRNLFITLKSARAVEFAERASSLLEVPLQKL